MDPAASLWWSTLDRAGTSRPALQRHLDVDVAIVGGGFSGLWTARELRRRAPDARILVIEQAVCGFGASGRNGGWASALYPLEDAAVTDRHGADALHHLQRVLRDAVRDLGAALDEDGVDAHFHQGGTLTFARSDLQRERLQAAARESDDHEWLDEHAARERARVSDLRGALYTPHCARVHPARLVTGLADAVERLGVQIVENTKVLRILPARAGRRATVVTAGGTVHADVVVRATEGFTPGLPGERRTVAPLYSLMIATEPLPATFWEATGFEGRETFTDGRHLLIYGQRTADDRIAFGGRGAPYHFGSTVEPRFDADDGVFDLLERTLRELFPHLEGAVTHRWGGPLAMPRDLEPTVTVDHASGLAALGGYTGDGVVLTRVAATALADLLSDPGRTTEFTSLPFVHHVSRPWEPEPFRWLGINIGLGLATWADHYERRTGRPTRATAWLEKLLG